MCWLLGFVALLALNAGMCAIVCVTNDPCLCSLQVLRVLKLTLTQQRIDALAHVKSQPHSSYPFNSVCVTK